MNTSYMMDQEFYQILLRNQPISRCTTFQCIIHLLIQNQCFKNDCYFVFYTDNLPLSEKKTLSKETKNLTFLPNKKCLNNVCIFSLGTEYGYQVNIILNNITSSAVYDPTCTFRGIATAEKF